MCGAGSREEVEEVVLAVASASTQLAKCDVVLLSEDDLRADGLEWKRTEGRTPVADLRETHVSLVSIDYLKLGSIARRVRTAIATDQIAQFRRQEVGELLLAALDEGRLQEEQVGSELNAALRRRRMMRE